MTDKEKIERLNMVLGTLIVWMAQSHGSPISVHEAEKLLEMLNSETEEQK